MKKQRSMPSPCEQLTAALRLPQSRKRAIAREIRAHLEESRRDLLLAGWDHDSVEAESVKRLGDIGEIADGFRRVYGPPRRRRVTLALVLACAGVASAYGVSGGLASATMVRPPVQAQRVRTLPPHHPRRPAALSAYKNVHNADGGRPGGAVHRSGN